LPVGIAFSIWILPSLPVIHGMLATINDNKIKRRPSAPVGQLAIATAA
jgi:hypothetical protein